MGAGAPAATLFLLVACAGGARPPTPPTGQVDPCLLEAPPIDDPGRPRPSPDAGADPAPWHIVFGEQVRPPTAARPPSRSEAIVYRHLYQPLVRLDCEGRAHPALARSWTGEREGRDWRLTLRGDARFGDGTPVTALDFVALRAPSLEAVRAAGPLEALFTFERRHSELPAVLADPRLAPKVDTGARWPVGAGPYRLPDPSSESATLLAVPVGRGRSIAFHQAPGTDLRDVVLLRGVDLLVSDDPVVRDYAATLAEFAVLPLPWDRVHVVAVPRAPTTDEGRLPDGLRVELARDAVRADARPATSGYWWESPDECPARVASASVPPGDESGAPRIAFRRDDPVARALAERLVALAAGIVGDDRREEEAAVPVRALLRARTVVARGEGTEDFPAAYRAGADRAYVLALPRRVYDVCGSIAALHDAAPWLERAGARLIPLIETRAHVVMRRGTLRLRVDWDGVPVVSERP